MGVEAGGKRFSVIKDNKVKEHEGKMISQIPVEDFVKVRFCSQPVRWSADYPSPLNVPCNVSYVRKVGDNMDWVQIAAHHAARAGNLGCAMDEGSFGVRFTRSEHDDHVVRRINVSGVRVDLREEDV